VSARASDGMLAALPISAALVLLLARWLPVRFDYVPNELGIVSLATLERYPQQQETFWLFFSAGVGTLLAWWLARWLRAKRMSPGAQAGLEALGALALLALLWLPGAAAFALCLAATGGALVLAARARAAGAELPEPAEHGLAAPSLSPARAALLAAATALLALALTPHFWVNLWNVAHGVADPMRTVDSFVFQGEIGQHLAWADALRRGGFHGKDFFCLYGPLYDLGGVGLWELVGRSIAAWELYFSITRALALLALLLLAAALLRRRAWLLALPFFVPWINLRVGLALFGLLFLGGWLRGGRLAWVALAGASGGVALLYSQEFGLAFVSSAALALALRRQWRPALLFAVGLAAVVAPLAAWYAANDALGPMLRDVVAYPGYVLAGYGKLPFPALAARLPLEASAWGTRELLAFQLGYAVPSICLAALLLAVRVGRLEPRRPLASAAELLASLRDDPWRLLVALTAFFGLLCFRTALGRSDLVHMLATLPAAALLVTVACDRVLGLWRAGPGLRPLAAWRSLALVLLLLHSGLLLAPTPLRSLRESAQNVATLVREGNHPLGSRRVMRVVRWIQLHTEPTDAVLFLPNNAAYYYLTERPSPIRFVMGHQIVTQAHRFEVLEALRASPPRFIVWDHDAARVDGVADKLVFGEALLGWIAENYAEETKLGSVEVLAPRRMPEERAP
jgi:hypothetical protein